jgi:ArsR family transcriptional regulator
LAIDLQAFKAEFFRALAHPARIRILEVLAGGERTVQDLQQVLGLEQPVVSQHLAVLRGKNIVSTRRVGTSVHYALIDPLITELLRTAREIFNRQLAGTRSLLKELQKERLR